MVAIDSTVWVALLGMLGLIVSTLGVAVVSLVGGRRRGIKADQDREHIKAQLETDEGADTVGQALSALDVMLREHVSKVEPMLEQQAYREEQFLRMEKMGLLPIVRKSKPKS